MTQVNSVNMTRIHELILKEQARTSYRLFREFGGFVYGSVNGDSFGVSGVIPVYDNGNCSQVDQERVTRRISAFRNQNYFCMPYHTHPYRPQSRETYDEDGLSKDDLKIFRDGHVEIVASSTAVLLPRETRGTDKRGRRILTKLSVCRVVEEDGVKSEEKLRLNIAPEIYVRRVAEEFETVAPRAV